MIAQINTGFPSHDDRGKPLAQARELERGIIIDMPEERNRKRQLRSVKLSSRKHSDTIGSPENVTRQVVVRALPSCVELTGAIIIKTWPTTQLRRPNQM